ncbi:hypothetical protein AMECASPLE_026668 [Ameca splendens]|uniref:Uncharacterized protein n=1 Tax=Ameca splendens TaxID=208324 RepID=A0ABV0XU11_9TELE
MSITNCDSADLMLNKVLLFGFRILLKLFPWEGSGSALTESRTDLIQTAGRFRFRESEQGFMISDSDPLSGFPSTCLLRVHQVPQDVMSLLVSCDRDPRSSSRNKLRSSVKLFILLPLILHHTMSYTVRMQYYYSDTTVVLQ